MKYCIIFILLFYPPVFEMLRAQKLLVITGSTTTAVYNLKKNETCDNGTPKKLTYIRQNKKPIHISAVAAFYLSIAAIIFVGVMPLIIFSSGFLAYEFGYLAFLLALGGVILAVRALADMQREPDFWRGKKRAKSALWMGVASAIGTGLAFLWAIKKA